MSTCPARRREPERTNRVHTENAHAAYCADVLMAKARQEVVEMKNFTDPKRKKMLGEITKNEAYVDYLKSRSDGRDAELALST